MKTIVIIHCGQTLCALERKAVREIAPLPHLSRSPSLPAAVEGLMNLAGEVVVVVDLARLMNTTPDPDVEPLYRHIVVLSGETSIALLVDRVEDVRQIDEAAIVPVGADMSVNGCVTGQVEIDGANVGLLDAGRLFFAAEQLTLADIQRVEQARLDALVAT